MKILSKLFSGRSKGEHPEDIMEITKIIGPLMDKTAQEIFTSHYKELLTEPVTYIVPAIWGAKKDGELTDSQKEMHKNTAPVIKDIMESFDVGELRKAQKFAISFLIRGYIISRITYMIEMAKNQGIKNIDSYDKENDLLKQVEPLGNA